MNSQRIEIVIVPDDFSWNNISSCTLDFSQYQRALASSLQATVYGGRNVAQLYSPGANTLARLVILALVTTPPAAVLLIYAYWRSPYATSQNVTIGQPVPFSHKHHVGDLGLDCRMCHQSVETSAFAGLPSTHTCMTCHSAIWTKAAMLAPVRESMAQNHPLRWIRVHRLPDYVFFDHHVHVKNGIGCASCHGPVQDMPLMRQAEPLTMGWCLSCHRSPEKFLRPENEIFNMTWTPPHDQIEQGLKLLRAYMIKTDHLSDCSVCHR